MIQEPISVAIVIRLTRTCCRLFHSFNVGNTYIHLLMFEVYMLCYCPIVVYNVFNMLPLFKIIHEPFYHFVRATCILRDFTKEKRQLGLRYKASNWQRSNITHARLPLSMN